MVTLAAISGFVFWGLVILVGTAYGFYVRLIKTRNKAKEALSGIEVQLQKRHSVIPNVLEIAKKFMDHEKSLFAEITELRTKATQNSGEHSGQELAKRFDIEETLQSKMTGLFATFENYPELKSNENMLQAQRAYNNIETNIAASRRFYNSAVYELNNSVEIFPGSIVAKIVEVEKMPFFKAAEGASAEVEVKNYM